MTIPLGDFENLHEHIRVLEERIVRTQEIAKAAIEGSEKEIFRLRSKAAGLDVEHEIQRQSLERLGIAWTPGEPFYSLVEAEIARLRMQHENLSRECLGQYALMSAEISRLRALSGGVRDPYG